VAWFPREKVLYQVYFTFVYLYVAKEIRCGLGQITLAQCVTAGGKLFRTQCD